MGKTSPTQRTLAYLREKQWTAQVVEKWNSHARIRQDLFGCIDIVALISDRIFGIQACAGASHAARRAKALAEPRLRKWMDAGGRFVVVSWSKKGPRGKRKLWEMRWDEITLAETRP